MQLNRVSCTLSAMCVMAASQVVFAQTRPSFTGEWARIDTATPRPASGGGAAALRAGDMGNVWESPFRIAQTADSLVVSFAQFSTYDLQPRLRYGYSFAAAESRNAVMIGHAESVQRSRVQWAGDTLVITTMHSGPVGPDGKPMATEVRQALAFAHDTLVVETVRAGVLGMPPSKLRSRYAHR